MKRVGVIVNPVAGMGGAVGLKGTDGSALLEQAISLGARPQAHDRALIALRYLADFTDTVEFFCFSGDIGETALLAARLKPKVVSTGSEQHTIRLDTLKAAKGLLSQGIELLLFVGGDGTARDIESVVKRRIPVIAIPAGVKMHSAVFCVSPDAAGQLASKYLSGATQGQNPQEVMDIDENSYREGIVSSQLFGFLDVPDVPNLVQGPKLASRSEPEKVMGIAQAVIEQLDGDTTYVIGPGTTTKWILAMLNLESTLVGVDVIRNKKMIKKDANESDISACIADSPCKIVVSVIGGQGFLFGRGNQQISENILISVGIENVIVVASPEKLMSLNGNPLRVDLGVSEVVSMFPDYFKVITGYNEETVYPFCKRSGPGC